MMGCVTFLFDFFYLASFIQLPSTGTLSIFIAEQYSVKWRDCLWAGMYSSTDGHSGWPSLSWTFVCRFSWSCVPAEMPRYTITWCLHFEELPNQLFFQSDYNIFRRERQHRQVSFLSLLLLFSHPCQPLMLSHFPYSYPNPCELIAHCGCISLMDNNTEHLFMHLLASPPRPCTPGKRNDSSGS